MRALNIELRERIVAEVDRKERTIREIAEIFQVSERTIYHLLRLRDEQGTLEARPHGGGAVAKITPKIQQALEAYVKEQPDITLAELQQMLRKRHRISVGVTTIWDALERAGLTVKKKLVVQAKPIRRSARRSSASSLDCQRLDSGSSTSTASI